MMLTPVVLPSGRRMLVTNLALTKSSDMAAMRMLVVAEHSQRQEDGVEVQGVACLSASNAGRRRADREHLTLPAPIHAGCAVRSQDHALSLWALGSVPDQVVSEAP